MKCHLHEAICAARVTHNLPDAFGPVAQQLCRVKSQVDEHPDSGCSHCVYRHRSKVGRAWVRSSASARQVPRVVAAQSQQKTHGQCKGERCGEQYGFPFVRDDGGGNHSGHARKYDRRARRRHGQQRGFVIVIGLAGHRVEFEKYTSEQVVEKNGQTIAYHGEPSLCVGERGVAITARLKSRHREFTRSSRTQHQDAPARPPNAHVLLRRRQCVSPAIVRLVDDADSIGGGCAYGRSAKHGLHPQRIGR